MREVTGRSVLAGGVLLLALWTGGLLYAEGARAERVSEQAPAEPAVATAATAGATYVGESTCLVCHEDMTRGYADTLHGRAALSRSPAATRGCESCHGPGSNHVEEPVPGSIALATRMAPREASEICLSCHTRGDHALWRGSAHDARNLSCGSCHSVHAPASSAGQLTAKSEADTCRSCHRLQSQKVLRVGHMPVAEGKMTCSSCHNPHGSTNVKLLKAGNWVNESCVSCHAEKRGPFLFEHAAGRESCVTCHDPHGSSNDRMLVAKLPMLCQRCHIGTRHPSTIYDSAAVRSNSNRVVGRGCVNCHQNIHGSNHPSGATFLR
ncbi:MAG: DmsE family decaheme c-type cytochrome [Acidimicrobiia bacterium]|nr:DmsE family decaheme c-type cytochrome [Acidimicrobiia bacterium]